MTIGGSILLLAVGAILAFAVTTTQVGGIQLDVVGFILMAAGLLGIVLGMMLRARPRRDGMIVERRPDVIHRDDTIL